MTTTGEISVVPGDMSSTRLPAPQSRRERELVAIQKLRARADTILRDFNNSFFMKERTPRDYPTFERSELKFGHVLGVGGFGIVFEVSGFDLKIPREVDIGSLHAEASNSPEISPDSGRGEPATTTGPEKSGDAGKPENAKALSGSPRRGTSDGSQTTAASTTVGNTEDGERTSDWNTDDLLSPDEVHYDVKTARKYMTENAWSDGDARYAVKRLHRDLSDLERTRAMIDLAIEAKFLATVWHPNIVKMRGIAAGPKLSDAFFIVMDRLYQTLKEKMGEWRDMHSENRGVLGFQNDKAEAKRLLMERLIVAHDLAAAYWYFHEHKIVYRDIKQENIGFDARGDVKVFDLGLCKGLAPSLKSKEGHGYLLTPRTGSVPYMAPEVVLMKPYDCQADVYSFAILLWEILSLKTAFKGYSRRDYLARVARKRERPLLYRQWPTLTRTMIKEAWDNDPVKRPSMKRVAVLLQGDINEMTCEAKSELA